MEIELLLTTYVLATGVFVLALCVAAARPIPQSDEIACGDEEINHQCLYEIATHK